MVYKQKLFGCRTFKKYHFFQLILLELVLNNREDFKTNETNEEIKTIVDNFALNQDNLWNFIDLTIPDSIVIYFSKFTHLGNTK